MATSLNGVPVHACRELIAAVRDDAAKGQTRWTASTSWKGGFACESAIRDHVIHMNEPEALGGTDTAPNMVEVVLAAYSSCLTVGYALNAALRGIHINSLDVDIEGDLDLAGFLGVSGEVPAGFRNIQASVYLDAEASEDELQELHVHVLQTSPVGSILERALPVATVLKTCRKAVAA